MKFCLFCMWYSPDETLRMNTKVLLESNIGPGDSSGDSSISWRFDDFDLAVGAMECILSLEFPARREALELSVVEVWLDYQ